MSARFHTPFLYRHSPQNEGNSFLLLAFQDASGDGTLLADSPLSDLAFLARSLMTEVLKLNLHACSSALRHA